jgi:hypothetical protein
MTGNGTQRGGRFGGGADVDGALAPSVAAVAAMIANITKFENAIPKNTSNRLSRSFDLAADRSRRRRGTALVPPMSFWRISSTRFVVCQKNR